jgi:hypothetical protein
VPFELYAGVSGGKPPVDLRFGLIAGSLPEATARALKPAETLSKTAVAAQPSVAKRGLIAKLLRR